MDSSKSKTLAVPIAIIIASLIVAAVIFFNSAANTPERLSANQTEIVSTELKAPVSIPTNSDFILGSPNAPLLIASYTNLTCTECRRLYDNLFALITRYGDTGSVSWMMRPHEDATTDSRLTNQAFCIGNTHSNQKFWQFIRDITEVQKADEVISDATSQRIAESLGVEWSEVENCINSNYYSDLLGNSINEIRASGATQIPSTVIFVGSEQMSIPNNLSYPALEGLVTQLLLTIQDNTNN